MQGEIRNATLFNKAQMVLDNVLFDVDYFCWCLFVQILNAEYALTNTTNKRINKKKTKDEYSGSDAKHCCVVCKWELEVLFAA